MPRYGVFAMPRDDDAGTRQAQSGLPRHPVVYPAPPARVEVWSDLPVFIQHPDMELIPAGIPMPEGTDLEKARQRLVIAHAKWVSIK